MKYLCVKIYSNQTKPTQQMQWQNIVHCSSDIIFCFIRFVWSLSFLEPQNVIHQLKFEFGFRFFRTLLLTVC